LSLSKPCPNIKAMSGPVQDLESVNDNLPVEEKLEIIRVWAKQSGYQVVADAVEHALIELQQRSKWNTELEPLT
jgi:hypothetical protein